MGPNQRLMSDRGVYTSIDESDEHNVDVMRVVMTAWLTVNYRMEFSSLDKDDWQPLKALPMDFIHYKFRARRFTTDEKLERLRREQAALNQVMAEQGLDVTELMQQVAAHNVKDKTFDAAHDPRD